MVGMRRRQKFAFEQTVSAVASLSPDRRVKKRTRENAFEKRPRGESSTLCGLPNACVDVAISDFVLWSAKKRGCYSPLDKQHGHCFS